jgi:hypothetical protein
MPLAHASRATTFGEVDAVPQDESAKRPTGPYGRFVR